MEVIDLTGPHNYYLCSFQVLGNPTPMPRPRRHWGKGVYNPARKEMKEFKAAVVELIPESLAGPIFPKGIGG